MDGWPRAGLAGLALLSGVAAGVEEGHGATADSRRHDRPLGGGTLQDFLIPMPRAVWSGITWRGSPPFNSTPQWMPVSMRTCFEDRELLKQQGEDFFLQRWPKVFTTRGAARALRPLDYALEVPREIQRGRASAQNGPFPPRATTDQQTRASARPPADPTSRRNEIGFNRGVVSGRRWTATPIMRNKGRSGK